MPWLNGGGVTHEIYREDDDRGLLFRVSTARVEANSLYSLFPKFQRISAVVEGNGIQLTNTETTEALRIGPTDIATLSGDTLYQGTLIDGGIRHLNLVFDPSRASAEMTFLEHEVTPLTSGAIHLVYCCAGTVSCIGDLIAKTGEILMTNDADEFRLSSDARAVHISVTVP